MALRGLSGSVQAIMPGTWLPAFLGDGLVAAHAELQFRASASEIARRAAGGAE